MSIWAGFFLGFLGSLHCIGMCGPIALSLPIRSERFGSAFLGQSLYNLGRTLTYALFGVAVGGLGWSASMAGVQEWMSLATGIGILLVVAMVKVLPIKQYFLEKTMSIFNWLKSFWPGLYKRKSYSSLFLIGFLNGFLPCGFVYVALAGALTTGGVLNATLFMALFGLGTVPVMAFMVHCRSFLSCNARQKMNAIMPAVTVALALLLILRGLSLGIPFVSPKLDSSGETKASCCSGKQHIETRDLQK